MLIGAALLLGGAVQAEDAARAVAGQAPVAARARRASRAWIAQARAVLRVRRRALLPLRRRARRGRGAPPRRLHAPGGAVRAALRRDAASSPTTYERGLSDLQFTAAYRVPFQYSRFVRQHLRVRGVRAVVVGRDGDRPRRQRVLRPDRLVRRQRVRQRLLQGVHASAAATACASWDPCWAATTPCRRQRRAAARASRGLDEVSFHMSGTEAVMQAVRLARYHTRRTHLVRFCGAYHGWWGDVQPGVGNPSPARETYTLKDMDEDSLRVLRTRKRHRLRAGEPAAGDAPQRQRAQRLRRWSTAHAAARFDRAGLHRLAAAAARGVHRARHRADLRRGVRRLPAGARAARRSTSASRADMVTYGKTLGGGLPGRRAVRRASSS